METNWKLLNPEKSFNVDGKDGFIDLFNKTLAKNESSVEKLNAVRKHTTLEPKIWLK
jgi:hypothetical protein